MEKTIIIEGMSCSHCTNRVKESLQQMNGVESVEMNLEEKSAKITISNPISEEEIKKQIEEAGYSVIEIK